jgi:proteasome accessory factor C
MSKAATSPGLERTERLLDLVPYLATHQGISLEDLAHEFSISTAQLTEDLTTLWMCGLPGYTALELMDLSFDTGFVSISNAETLARPRMLNRDEVLALILGLETLREEAEPDHNQLVATITQLISKLVEFLDANVQGSVQAGTSVLAEERGIIEEAIASRGAVEISYHSISRDEVSRRIIHPLEFSTVKENDYVLAYCELTMSYRTFRLDRVREALTVEFREEVATTISPNNQAECLQIKVKVDSRLRDLVERFNLEVNPANQGWPERPPDRLEVEIFSSDWAVREIMSFGGDIELESPQDLRKSLQARARRSLDAYKPRN